MALPYKAENKEKTNVPTCSDEVIIVISDNDEESGVNSAGTASHVSLFDEFVTSCHQTLMKIREPAQVHKIEKHLLKVHKAARPGYVASEEFTNTLRHHLVEIRKPDLDNNSIFSHISDVLIHLKNASSKSDQGKCDTLQKPTVEKKVTLMTNGESSTSHATHDQHVEINGSTSCNTTELGDKELAGEVRNKNKIKVRRLEKLMGRLDREIRRYSEKELSLEEMENDDSAHMIEHKLRKRFVEAWQKWNKLKGYEAKSGRVIEKKIRFHGTQYPEINRRIQKLLNNDKFPDFHDVFRIVQQTNQSKNLCIHRLDLHHIAKEVFQDIGEKLSQRRKDDSYVNFGYASFTDATEDPADSHSDLRDKLIENASLGKRMMDGVLEKYTHKARELVAAGREPEVDYTSEPEALGEEEEGELWEECSTSIPSDSNDEEGNAMEEKAETKTEPEDVSVVPRSTDTRKRPLDDGEMLPAAKTSRNEDAATTIDEAAKCPPESVENGLPSERTDSASSVKIEPPAPTLPQAAVVAPPERTTPAEESAVTNAGKSEGKLRVVVPSKIEPPSKPLAHTPQRIYLGAKQGPGWPASRNGSSSALHVGLHHENNCSRLASEPQGNCTNQAPTRRIPTQPQGNCMNQAPTHRIPTPQGIRPNQAPTRRIPTHVVPSSVVELPGAANFSTSSLQKGKPPTRLGRGKDNRTAPRHVYKEDNEGVIILD